MGKKWFLVILFSILLVGIVSAQTSQNSLNSDNYVISGSGTFSIDTSFMPEVQKVNVVNSLTKLSERGEIDSILERDSSIIFNLGEESDLKRIEVNNLGVSITDFAPSYIVEFKDPPVLAREKELEDEIENLRSSAAEQKRGGRFAAAQSVEKTIQEKKQEKTGEIADYRNKLVSDHRAALLDLQNKIETKEGQTILTNLFFGIKRLTGNLVGRITGRQIEETTLEPEAEFYNVFNGVVLHIPAKDARKISESDFVKAVHLNKDVEAFLFDSVPLIKADSVWNLGYTGENVTIAIIDTGVDYTHPDLGGCFGADCKVIGGYDFINNDNDPMDDQGHGTHVAATAAGNGTLIGEIAKHTFFFLPIGGVVELQFKTYTGFPEEIGILHGIEGIYQFFGTGSSDRGQIPVSLTNETEYDEDTNAFFFASWNSSGRSETHKFVIANRGYIDDDTINIDDTIGNEECDAKVGDVCRFGKIVLTVKEINASEGTSRFEISEEGSFDKIFDQKGSYIYLPRANEFPTDRYNFTIYDSDDNIIDSEEFFWNQSVIEQVGGEDVKTVGLSEGLRGVAPDAKIYAYKVLNSAGSGSFSGVILGIERAVDPDEDGDFSDHVDIISMSLGGPGDPDDPVSQAIDRAVDAGVVAVIAAGNNGPFPGSILSPGTARKAITVGATDKSDVIAEFSSRGPVIWSNGTLIKPDLAAPGVDICAAQWDNWLDEKKCLDQHIAISGTSMATPHVAGIVALIKQKHQDLIPEEIKNLLKSTAIDLGYDANTQGTGRVDALASINSKIIISGDFDFGQMNIGQMAATKTLKIKNIADDAINLTLNAENASDEEGNTLSAVSLSRSSLTIQPGAEEEIDVNLNFPLTFDGLFGGRIIVNDGESNYSILYAFSRFSKLTLTVEGDHFPNFYVHDNNLNRIYSFWQGGGFIGNSFTFNVKSGEYTAYAINDFINPENPLTNPETDEYILIDIISVPINAEIEKIFRLEDARKFTLKTESISGKTLKLTEWHKGVSTYKNKFDFCDIYAERNCVNNPENLSCYWDPTYGCSDKNLNINFFDPLIGDREIYLSNKPDNGLDTDITLKYIGVENE